MSKVTQVLQMAESHLRELIQNNAADWESRKKLAQLLYNEGKTEAAADVIWSAPEIPSIDLELGFAIKILGKGAPRKAIRLLTSVLELNKGKPVQNLAIANALMHYGMVMQAARFYGAALQGDDGLVNPDLEHFLLWTDDKEKIWGDFDKDKPVLGELPWMKRNAMEAAQLKKAMSGHTTPVKIPGLNEVSAESVVNEMYVQSPRLGSQATPPPSVTIPLGRVNPKDIVVDPLRGAGQPVTAEQAQAAAGPVGLSTGSALPAMDQPIPTVPIMPPTPPTPPTPPPTAPLTALKWNIPPKKG